MAGSFEIKKGAKGQFHFNLKANNGEVILSSEMYAAKRSANAGIASVQVNHSMDERYKKETATNGKFYFALKAGNHQVIGTSQMYATESSRDAGIKSVKTNGGTKVVKDNS